MQRAYSQGEILARHAAADQPEFERHQAAGDRRNQPRRQLAVRRHRVRMARPGQHAHGGKPKFREMDMKLRKVGAFVYATDELLADAIALEAWINRYLPLELTFRTEDASSTALGGNQPQGIAEQRRGHHVTRKRGQPRPERRPPRDVESRMWAPLRSNAVWLVDQSVEPRPRRAGGADRHRRRARPVVQAGGQRARPEVRDLQERPIIPVEYMAALGTTGDIVLVGASTSTPSRSTRAASSRPSRCTSPS
jgi:HK97 family phage major capsid protein